MSAPAKSYLTPRQYLEIERKAECKSEYFNGEMWAKTRVNEAHCLVAVNILVALREQVRSRDCEVLISDMRVCTSPDGFYTYPDVLVCCGNPQLLDSEEDTLLNPFLIAEVLLPSPETYGRSFKFEQYKLIGSLQEYLLVSSHRVHADLWTLHANGQWLPTTATRLEDTIRIPSLDCSIKLADLYNKVTL
jgi:Uma2 family endonuclease